MKIDKSNQPIIITAKGYQNSASRDSPLEVFLRKDILKIRSKFTGEHLGPSVILIKFQNNFIKITLRHGCSFVNLLHVFRTHPVSEQTKSH